MDVAVTVASREHAAHEMEGLDMLDLGQNAELRYTSRNMICLGWCMLDFLCMRPGCDCRCWGWVDVGGRGVGDVAGHEDVREGRL